MTTFNPAQIDGQPIKELPLSALIQPAKDIVSASGLRSFTQRGFFTKGSYNYFIELGQAVPLGELRALFPDWEEDEILTDGWENVSFDLELSATSVTMIMRGFYHKAPVPVDVTLTLGQGEAGYTKDSLTIFDRRTEKQTASTFKEVMETRMKSGDYKYAGSSDTYGEMAMVRILKVLNRFLKDWSLKNRIIERD